MEHTGDLTIQALLERIRREQSSFSPAQRLVAAYVVENAYQIPFLSITRLARNIGVSDSTVIKFCNQIGFAKFGQFKKAISQCTHSELVMSNKLSQSTSTEQSHELFPDVMQEDITAVRATMANPVNHNALAQLLPMVSSAQHIYITAGRASSYMAGLLANALRYLGLKVHEISFGVGDYWDKLSLIEKSDLVIAISFPRYTSQLIDTLEVLHGDGIPIALITDTGLSPAVPYADIIFHCAVSSSSYFPCYSGCLSLINALCRAVGAYRKDEAADHISRLERRLIEQDVFR